MRSMRTIPRAVSWSTFALLTWLAVPAMSDDRRDVSTAGTAPEPILLVTSRNELQGLEQRGLGFDAVVGGADRERIVSTLTGDLRRIAQRDRRAGVGIRFSHRLFDARWLGDARFRFELVGIVNRIDRRAFHPGTCGETRLVYRLAYATPGVSGRVPMTVNVVFFQPADDAHCSGAIRRWARSVESLDGPSGALESSALGAARLKSIEVDLQSVRWPSTIRPDLGGHAEYILRVFRRDASGRLAPAPLENQPDVERLTRDRRLRSALLAWLREPTTLQGLDRGVVSVPDEFLARETSSHAPHGLARPANSPFRTLFSPNDFAGLDLTGMNVVKSPAAVLRRLDAMSCTGCHQSRSLAGFHLLGEDRGDDSVDALASGASPHLHGDLARRTADARALLLGRNEDIPRGFPEQAGIPPRIGSHCGLSDPSFASWTCPTGARCVAIGDAEVGVCVGDPSSALGDACEPVSMTSSDRRGARGDRGTSTALACSANASCDGNRLGFPDGACLASCASIPRGSVEAACGAIPSIEPFNACLARREPFERCVATTSSPSAVLACDAARPCRDDYVCTRTSSGVGACMPPYFLFQLRVDGHPL